MAPQPETDPAERAARAGRIADALAHYERIAAGRDPSAEVLVDAAVLYWQCTEYGFWTSMRLAPELPAKAAARFPALLSQAESLEPGNLEVEFWRRYIAWTDRGEPFRCDECRAMLRASPGYLEPAMYLYATSGGAECVCEAEALLEECRARDTARARYVASVLEGVKRRTG